MTRRVLVVHYTPPGVIGGVEHIIHQHADLLRARGFEVTIVAGRPGVGAPPVEVVPEIDVASPPNIRLEAELAAGAISPRFESARNAIQERLGPLVRLSDAIIVHNAFTLHFSLPLTSALWELAGTGPTRKMLAWCHDLSWTNPLYIPTMHAGYPWELLRLPAPGVRYITVSSERRNELSALWSNTGPEIAVVPNGIDPAASLRLSPLGREIASTYDLFARDLVILLPVRITRRKNVELAIRAVRRLVDRGHDVLFLVSGPTAPHHPVRSRDYLSELKAIARDLDVGSRVVFLADARGENLPLDVLPELYAMADVLLFPSSQEGFGLPILEAGLARMPVVLSDIPIFREVGGVEARWFKLNADADTIAAEIEAAMATPQAHLYRRVLREYSWENILTSKILPILA